ncbi:MAG: sigma-54 dependent transcriptional regulator [Pseudomonadota bacterium]
MSDTPANPPRPPPQRILVIDDESVVCHSCRRSLTPDGHEVEVATDPYAGLEVARKGEHDILLLDIVMPGISGLEVFRTLRREGLKAEVIFITGYAEVQTAVEAMKLGAADFIGKPFSPEELRLCVRRVAERSALIRENTALRAALARDQGFHGMVGDCRAMQEVYALIRRVAPSEATVLITGESGTGKELVARALHRLSARRDRPLVACDCSSLAPGVLESELFGHVKGSFSGAIAHKRGLFEVADKGTLFLDEVSNIGLETQGKLLRALESRRVRRVGDTEERAVDIRLIAASNRSLVEMIGDGSFREDLYYRLNVIPIALPPLRERREDIARLALAFLERHQARAPSLVRTISPEALAVLEDFPWPGNVRELKNMVERIAILCPAARVEPVHLPPELRQGAHPAASPRAPATWEEVKRQKRLALEKVVRDIEVRFLVHALDEAHGNVTRAAEAVGMQRTNFHALMRRYEITSDRDD